MENRHLNVNNSPTHSINNSISNLTISDGLPNSNLNPINNHLQRRNEHSTMKPLNPNAEMFIPRCMMIPSNQTSSYVGNPQHPNSSTNNHPISNGNPHNQYHHHQQQQHNHQLHSNNGTIQNSSSFLDGETDIEDYVALSYLKEFIGNISNMPSHYDQGISEITFIVNSYLDEDECVLELIVNQIVDQSIIDVNFRYNGVRLCFHFMEKIRPTNSGQTFKNILFKRCQRECSRKVSQSTSSNTFNHLRGLSVFVADLYLRCKETQLADNLPNLLMNILSSNNNIDENVKCVCQVLKLCGKEIDLYFREQKKDDVKTVLETLEKKAECDISVYIKDMVKSIIKLSQTGWTPPEAPRTNIKNPYADGGNPELHSNGVMGNDLHQGIPGGYSIDPSMSYPQMNPNRQFQNDKYVFGDEELDESVYQDFEKFLLSLPQNN